MYKATKLNADLTPAPVDGTAHEILNVQREILGQPIAIMYATVAPPAGLPWEKAKEWCAGLRVGGFEDWRLARVEPAVLALDYSRTEEPFVDPTLLPNHAGKAIWTGTEDLTPPRGYAFSVGLGYGIVYRGRQSYHGSALPCRPGQWLG